MTGWFILPAEIHHLILLFIDVPSVCHLYVALSPRGQLVAAFLADKTVEVTPKTVIEGDSTYISFAVLRLLPPCHVKAHIYPTLQRLVPEWFKRRQFSLLHIVLDYTGPFGAFFHLQDWNMRIDTLEVVEAWAPFIYHCETETRVVFKNCAEFSITGDCVKSFEVYVEARREPYEIGTVPVLVEKLVLPVGVAYDASNLTNLKHVDGGSITNAPWSQLQSYTGVTTAVCDRFDAMVEYTSGMTDPAFTFRNSYCPKLEKVTLKQVVDIDDQYYEISQLFTKSQMAQLVCLNVPGYHILDFDPLVNLQELHMATDEHITSTFPFPSSVVCLEVHTYGQVVGIPAHVKVLKITGESSRVKIRSSTLRELEASARNVVVDCPHLTRLTLSGVWRYLYLNTPNVVFLELNAFRYTYRKLLFEEKFPFLAHLSLNDYRAQDELYIPQPLKSAKLSLMELKSLTLTADDVSLWCCKLANSPVINAQSITTYQSNIASVLQFNCYDLKYLYEGSIPRLLRSVTLWMLPNDFYLSNVEYLPPDVFVGCEHLQSIWIRQAPIAWSDQRRLFIPKSVKQLLLSMSITTTAWLEFEDESTLEHFELFDEGSHRRLRWLMETLGLTIPPKSFIVPWDTAI